MSTTASVEADPSQIGGVPKAPYVVLPDPLRLFERRATRFDALATESVLAPYLRFLAALTRSQADLARTLPPPARIPDALIARAKADGMPPVDRIALADAPVMSDALDRLFDAAVAIEKPDMAARALDKVRAADAIERAGMIRNVLSDAISPEALAQHLYVAAATQIVAAMTAATLDADPVSPVETGVCPVCGGPPLASLVVGFHGAEGVRYAVCACCATQWNEVRVRCLVCGSTKGIGYRAVADDGAEKATIKAEVCDECGSWVKILYQNQNPSLDAVADDVASLGLNVLMRDSDYRAAGYNPLLIGY